MSYHVTEEFKNYNMEKIIKLLMFNIHDDKTVG